MNDFERITQDPEVMGGKPCIRGQRVTVGMILGQLAAGQTVDALLVDFPYLEREGVALRGVARGGTRDRSGDRVKILVDKNLSPRWAISLTEAGFEAIHWSAIGPANAPDRTLFDYAALHDFVILTHDLDFGDILAAGGGRKPSVVQILGLDLRPEAAKTLVLAALNQTATLFQAGALVTIDMQRTRVRILPL